MIDNLLRHKLELLDSLDAESRKSVLNSGRYQERSLVYRHRDRSPLSSGELRLLASLNEDDIESYRSRGRKRSAGT
jgi:hypothetical protein